MKCLKVFLASLIFICASPIIATEGNNPWKLLIDRNGVKIYNRDMAGSPIREFMGRCVVDASLYTVGVLMLDFTAYPEWVASCKDLRSVACRNTLNCDLYYIMALPWPVSNRDVILRAVATVYPDEGVIHVQCDAIPDDNRVPVPSGYVRLKAMYVKWILKQLPDGKTDVTFLSWAEPGGFVPSFVANMSTSDFPYKSLLNLARMVRLPKYVEMARGMNGQNYKQKMKLSQ
ncbi:MAG: hypothetical protein CVV44_14680 [Spirochaetae bacterium HGW-Spirochaetae-1]|jgi:hypothetical protein|nr:MAG: hypothetical protein CVV44_14680 [Spirochaetae bacterium HGW-Spirochaetae-1]